MTLNRSDTEEVWSAVCIPSRSPAPELSLGIVTPGSVTSQRGVSGSVHAACLLSTPGFLQPSAASLAHPCTPALRHVPLLGIPATCLAALWLQTGLVLTGTGGRLGGSLCVWNLPGSVPFLNHSLNVWRYLHVLRLKNELYKLVEFFLTNIDKAWFLGF